MKTKQLILTSAIGLGLFASPISTSQAAPEKKGPDPAIVAGEKTQAMLDKIDNWQPLFNGKDFTGWTGDTANYKIDGANVTCPAGAKTIATEKEYGDFILDFEFKLGTAGNNGIGLRVPKDGTPHLGGMEIQILDSKYEKAKDYQMHGSIYGVVPAKTGYLKPAGEWNHQTIICIEDHVKVIVNGAVIVDAYLDQVSPIDGHEHPGLRNPSGHLMLLGHNDHVEFKDLRIADYSPSPAKPASDKTNTPPAGFAALFNGKDLSGWKGLADGNAIKRRELKGDDLKKAQEIADQLMNEHWSVKEGVLVYDGTGKSLCTAKDYGDFEFYVDWKIPQGADSGIYLRGTPQVQIWDPWDNTLKDPKTKESKPATTPEDIVAAYRTGRNLGSGGLWNNIHARNQPLVLADNPIGEWNTFLIRMVGEKVTIWLNGKLVVDRTVLENYWDKTRTTPVFREDQIELQHHGSDLYFKNLYIREIPY
jgi:hypothetical protein